LCVRVSIELIREFEVIGSTNLHLPAEDVSTASVSFTSTIVFLVQLSFKPQIVCASATSKL